MKSFQLKTGLLMLSAVCTLAACKKDDKQSGVIGFDAFKILASNNEWVGTDISAVINNSTISFKVPSAVDVTILRPTFTLSNPETIVYANKQPQENGIDSIDFTDPVKYDLKTRGGSRSFTVTAIKTTAFTKFRLLAANNSGVLFADYTSKIRGLFVEIKVPLGTDVRQLKAMFETTQVASVKVNGNEQQSGVSVQDFTDTVKYTITDADGTSQFKVKVVFLTKWELITKEPALPEAVTSTSLKIAVNPVTKLPYVVYQITSSKKIGVSRFNGSSWEQIDGGGISEGEGREPMLAFDKMGVLYIGYRDYADLVVTANQQKLTVRKYENNSWSAVGNVRFTPTKADYESIGVDGNNIPWVSLAKASATADGSIYERRQLYTMKFENGTWTVVDMTIKTSMLWSRLVTAGDKLYMGILDRTTTLQKLSVFELVNKQWVPYGPQSFVAENKNAYFQMALAIAPDGTKYVAYHNRVSAGDRTNYVMKYNGSTWDVFGSSFAVPNAEEIFDLAVHPDGTVYYTYLNSGGLQVLSYNKQTNNWAAPTLLTPGAVSSVDLVISDGDNPSPYIVAGINSKMQVWKLDIPK